MAPPKQKAPKGHSSKVTPQITDPRFANIHSDPRFRLPSKKNTRVTVDKRFAHMLKDDDFSKKATVDRYGRKVAKDAGKKELQRFYRVEDEDEEEEDKEEAGESDDADDDDEVQKELAKADRKYDPAREGGFSSSEDESDSDEEESEVEVEEDEVEFPQGQDADVPMGEVSARLAAVNLDWDNIRAQDLMAVASSFAPEGGRIMNVTVYPSEFGRERMEREELEGPPREIFKKARASSPETSDEDEEDEEIKKDLLQEDKGEEFDSKALRQYQLERLRYYYALITTDSAKTAQHLYENMDGREYLSSANFFDLRFVPDSVSFDGDKPRDQCSRLPDGYRPNDFVTDALTHSRVKLTWDADDTTRKEVQKRAFSQKEIDDNDMQAYIGSDSSSDEDEPEEEVADASSSGKKKAKEDKAAKLRAALGLSTDMSSATSKKSKEDRPVGDMQVTFTSGLNSKANGTVFENEPIIEETTKEKYIRKEKERKQRRKEKMKAARGGVDADADASAAEEEETETTAPIAAAEDEEADPFNDPFFDDPEGTTKRAAKEARKAEKARKREAREAQAAADAAERAQLELLMADETGAPAGLRHFDMGEIEKAEKAAKRKGKGRGKNKKKGETEAGDEPRQAGFEMDTKDPRFAALFESHEFAIDPTNPKFKGTAGMKALLEEGRKKRKAQRDDGLEEEVRRPKKSKAVDGGAAAGGGEDIKKLVERVKGKTKKVKA